MSAAPVNAPVSHRRKVAWVLFGVGAVLTIGWPIAAWINWANIVSSHARLGYLAGDLGLVTPLCYLCWHGFRINRPWAPLLFLIACGAMAFDSLHFTIYLIQERFLGIPAAVYALVLMALLYAIYRLAAWEFRALGAVK